MALTFLPNAGQSLGVTRAAIRQNFVDISTQFEVDHGPYNSPNQGQHVKLTMFNNVLAPAFINPQIGMFNITQAPTGRPDIWLARGATAPFPMTGYINSNAGLTRGWTYLPSGLKILFGDYNTGGGIVTVTYNNTALGGVTGFPGFSTFWTQPICQRIHGAGPINPNIDLGIVVQGATATQFNAYTSNLALNVPFSYIVIGM